MQESNVNEEWLKPVIPHFLSLQSSWITTNGFKSGQSYLGIFYLPGPCFYTSSSKINKHTSTLSRMMNSGGLTEDLKIQEKYFHNIVKLYKQENPRCHPVYGTLVKQKCQILLISKDNSLRISRVFPLQKLEFSCRLWWVPCISSIKMKFIIQAIYFSCC